MYFNIQTEVEFEVDVDVEDGVVEIIVSNCETGDSGTILNIYEDGSVEYFPASAEDIGLIA